MTARIASRRLAPGQLDEARMALGQAWRNSGRPLAFAAHHLVMTRALLRAAAMYPMLWLLNDVAEIHHAMFGQIPVPVPDDYLVAHERFFDALERGDGEAAEATMSDYMDRFETNVITTLRKSL